MWTVIRFALADDTGYDTAAEILRGAGFRAHQVGDSPRTDVLPGYATADVLQDPAVVARAVFEAFAEARLRPVAVTGAEATSRRARPEALASP